LIDADLIAAGAVMTAPNFEDAELLRLVRMTMNWWRAAGAGKALV
jgi:hypothetical protein